MDCKFINKNYNIVSTKTEYKYIEKNIPVYISDNGLWQEFECTGYSLNDKQQGTNSTVSIGIDISNHKFKVIAVDPNIIPLYSIVEIQGMGAFIAIDTGGLIQGKRIDILFDTKYEAKNFGVQNRLIKVIQ